MQSQGGGHGWVGFGVAAGAASLRHFARGKYAERHADPRLLERMGITNKLLEKVDDIPLVLRAANAALASRAASVTVVTGHAADSVATLVGAPRMGLDIVHNPEHAQGMSTSLKCGIAALPENSDGALVLLGDMPRISAAHLDALIDAFAEGEHIIVPTHAGQRGNPVLWPRRFFAEFQPIDGDQGARGLLKKYIDQIKTV